MYFEKSASVKFSFPHLNHFKHGRCCNQTSFAFDANNDVSSLHRANWQQLFAQRKSFFNQLTLLYYIFLTYHNSIDSSIVVLGVICWSPPIRGLARSKFGEFPGESQDIPELNMASLMMFGGASMCKGDCKRRQKNISRKSKGN